LLSATINGNLSEGPRELMKPQILKKFEDEIQQLEKELKTELPKEIKRARELGDLRENAEYQAAKERQRLVESRISMLKKRVSEISLMNLDRIPHDKVGFGSTVHLKDPAGTLTVYQLVMPEDADAEHGLISTASPIGRALLNKEEGDEVTVTTPNGSRTFEVIKLVTIHDE
jgi:transcription elongation factor GreA